MSVAAIEDLEIPRVEGRHRRRYKKLYVEPAIWLTQSSSPRLAEGTAEQRVT